MCCSLLNFLSPTLQLITLQPSLLKDHKHKVTTLYELSRGIRTLLAWYREVKKGGGPLQTLHRKFTPLDQQLIQDVLDILILKNPNEKLPDGDGGAEWLDVSLQEAEDGSNRQPAPSSGSIPQQPAVAPSSSIPQQPLWHLLQDPFLSSQQWRLLQDPFLSS